MSKAPSETDPLVGEEKSSAKKRWGDLSKNVHQEHVNKVSFGAFKELHASVLEKARDKHNEVRDLAVKSTQNELFHQHFSGKEAPPSQEECDLSMTQFKLIMFGPLFLVAFLTGTFGLAAIYFSYKYPEESSCPFPLSKYVFYYGCSWLVSGLSMLCTVLVPPMFICQYCATLLLQVLSMVLLVCTLISYGKAAECGHEAWWTAIIFASFPVACCVWCCCSPFGVAKASAAGAAFVSYKAMAVSMTPALAQPPPV